MFYHLNTGYTEDHFFDKMAIRLQGFSGLPHGKIQVARFESLLMSVIPGRSIRPLPPPDTILFVSIARNFYRCVAIVLLPILEESRPQRASCHINDKKDR